MLQIKPEEIAVFLFLTSRGGADQLQSTELGVGKLWHSLPPGPHRSI